MRFIVMFRVILILCIVTACSEQDAIQENVYQGKKSIAQVYLSSNSTANLGDAAVQTVRCIVFTNNDELVSNELQVMSGEPYAMITTVAYGRNDFYIICNETPELTKSLENIRSASQLDNVRFIPPTTGITVPLPMYSEVLNTHATFKEDGSGLNIKVGDKTSDKLEVQMVRIVPKIDLTVIKNVTGSTDFAIEEMSYRLCRVPKYSALKPGIAYPQGEEWGTEIESVGSGKIKASSNGVYNFNGNDYTTIPADLDAIHFPTVYAPEHLLEKQNTDYCTYMLIEAKCVTENSSSVIQAKYKVNLGEKTATNYDLKRNVNYRIYATISGLGATGFYAEIVPVDEYDLPLTWKPFEGYAIVGERMEDYGNDLNIWNSYSQYSGIMKVVKDNKYSDALFRYGSIVALAAGTSATEFNATTEVLWRPDAAKTTQINSWGDITHFTSEDISETTHTLENIKAGKGDPCRLVGLSESEISSGKVDNKLWRMPTAKEMEWLKTARNSTVDNRGFYSFSYLLTPFTGYRSPTGTLAPDTKATGHYWSATNANSLTFDNTNTSTIGSDDPEKAYAIRCIRTDIPESIFQIDGQIIEHTGGTTSLTVNPSGTVVTPYWRMELENPADIAYLSLSKKEGSIKESNIVTVKPAENPYIKKNYPVKVTGYGLDGKVHEKRVIVSQKELGHIVAIKWTSVPELQIIDGHYRIPQAGATISFKMEISPEPDLRIYPNFDNKEWRIQTQYYTSDLQTEYGTPVARYGVSEIVIKPNTWGHLLGLEFKMTPALIIGYPTHISESIVFIQEK